MNIRKKLQQSLAVNTIHNKSHNTSSKVLNKTQLNTTNINNDNTSMSVSFYINNSMLNKETESSSKKKNYLTITNSARSGNRKCSKAEEEEEIQVRTIRKPFKKISQYIENYLYSLQKKKYVIPRARYSSACKIKTRVKKVYRNDEMNPREFPRKLNEGPIDISCLKRRTESNLG